MIYLDVCATTPVRPEVALAVSDCLRSFYGNPSSLHRVGLEAEELLRKARQVTAAALGVKPSEVIYTSGGSESNNLALKGAALAYRGRGNHLIISRIEHASVYESAKQLEELGFRLTELPVDRTGAVRLEELELAIGPETILVSLMAVNNETGRLQPVREAGELLARHPRILYHIDAVQALGKIPLELKAWQADMASFAAHKFGGPKGVGFLYRRQGIQLVPLIAGGGQEMGLRSGTENVPLIVGAAKAARLAAEETALQESHLRGLRKRLVYRLAEMPGIVVHGSEDPMAMAPHVVQFSCPGYKPEVLVHALEAKGYCISTRSACASGEETPSRVLEAMGLPREVSVSALRVSFAAAQTAEELDGFADALEEALHTITPKQKGTTR